MPDLLIELFSEEIPARMQGRAREDLKKLVTDGLVEAGLTYAGAGAFSTPRRLTLTVQGLTAESRAVREERKGPSTTAPQQAIDGFLRSTGLTLDQLERRADKKGETFFAVVERPGRKAPAIIAEVLEATIRNFPWPKSMRWGAGSLRWVRPLHSILCILSDEAGAEVVPLDVDGIRSGNTTEGHRFMAPGRFAVSSFDDYAAKLRAARVMLDPAEREAHIWNHAVQTAFAQGLEVVEDKALLTEVAGLVEWPVPLMGPIADEFLHLPAEVLQTSMREHQKFFSVKNPKTGRIEKFLTVANTETADHGETILKGNGKVLAARLSDARFFWDNDLRVAKAGMTDWAEGLKTVTFHNKLGSQADRIERIAALARELAPVEGVGADPDDAEQAARMAKLDLRSAMVGEFPELQGVMGRYYALAALQENPPRPPSRGLDATGGPGSSPGRVSAIADAARDHYSPLGPTDAVPTAPVSVAVALADKLDTLTGFWAIDEKPTGSKDPFALRRAALGVIRLVLGNGVRTDIQLIVSKALFLLLAQQRQPLPASIYGDWSNEDYARLAKGEDFHRFGLFSNFFFQSDDDKAGGQLLFRFLDMTPHERPYFASSLVLDYLEEDQKVDIWGHEFERNELIPLSKLVLERVQEVNALPVDIRGSASIFVSAKYPELWGYCLKIANDLLAFFHDRLKVFLKDEGIRHDVIDACLAMPGNDDLTLLVKRARALSAMLATEDGTNLIQGFRRANNILTQAEQKDGVEYSYGPDPKFAETPEEAALFTALDAAEAKIAPAMGSEDFAAAMAAMAALRAPIDAFFTAVQVNSDNPIIRRNRLNLLHRIRAVCGQVADLARIEG